MAIQGDGKIVLGGTVSTGSTTSFAIARYNTDGSLDSSFGTGGQVISDPGYGSLAAGFVAIEGNGKILMAGYPSSTSSAQPFLLACFNTDGSVDTSFGSGGVIASSGMTSPTVTGLVIDPAGGAVLMGSSVAGGVPQFTLVRVNLHVPVPLYAQHDANFNVTALTDSTGAVVQRFQYDPYGTVTVLSPSWSSTTDAYNWKYLFQGMRYDPVTGLYETPNRDLNPATDTWLQADPAGYVDGSNLYQALDARPTTLNDALGLDPAPYNTNDLRSISTWALDHYRPPAYPLPYRSLYSTDPFADRYPPSRNPDDSVFTRAYKELYCGDESATDEEYAAARTAAGDWLYPNSVVRGVYLFGGPTVGLRRDSTGLGVQGGVGVSWDMDTGATGGVEAYGVGQGQNAWGGNGLWGGYNQTTGWTSGRGGFTGSGNASGGEIGVDTDQNVYFGLNYGWFNMGLILDPSKASNTASWWVDKWNALTSSLSPTSSVTPPCAGAPPPTATGAPTPEPPRARDAEPSVGDNYSLTLARPDPFAAPPPGSRSPNAGSFGFYLNASSQPPEQSTEFGSRQYNAGIRFSF
jgi:uncharacterized delta-60 repeat protein/RHS repeat-associated protein